MTDGELVQLRGAVADAGLTIADLWLRYFALGGMSTVLELEAYLCGSLRLPGHDQNVLVHALNERFSELGRRQSLPYTDD